MAGRRHLPGHLLKSTGDEMTLLIDDTIYFDANDGSHGVELWAHNTSNGTTWLATDIRQTTGSGPGDDGLEAIIGDTMYFSAYEGSGTGRELHAYDTSNHSSWLVSDIRPGGDISYPSEHMMIVAGDTLYFDANDGSDGLELWAHDTSNGTTWLATTSRVGQRWGVQDRT